MTLIRTRQPDLLRERILDATQEVLLSDGFALLTQERVLQKLAISKGGLQHHFRTKAQLIDGLFERLFASFVADYAELLELEPEGPARYIRTYLRMAMQGGERVQVIGRAITLLAISEEKYLAEWADYTSAMDAADSIDKDVHMACRMFADGLWYSHVIGPPIERKAANAAYELMLGLIERT